MKRSEIKICGFGGQGIILSGYIMGKAATLYDDKHATLTQSYGPESRGGACNAQVIIADQEIDYPEVLKADVLIIMSKEAYGKYINELDKNGILIYDNDLVENSKNLPAGARVYSIPATRFAEELGKKIIANIIMLGFFVAITKAVKVESMESAILSSIPPGSEDLNMKAFHKGYDYGRNMKN